MGASVKGVENSVDISWIGAESSVLLKITKNMVRKYSGVMV